MKVFNFQVPLNRPFSSSAPRSMLRDHRLFDQVNWDLVEAGQYAVVDPITGHTILYVSYQDYLVLIRVAMSNNVTLKVLAAPGETRPSTSSSTRPASQSPLPDDDNQNSPTNINDLDKHFREFFFPRVQRGNQHRRASASRLLLQSPLLSFVDSEQKSVGTLMIKLTDRNISQWFTKWYNIVHWWSRASEPGPVTRAYVVTFGLRLRDLLRHEGVNKLIMRFKISLFVINAYLGGRKLTTTQGLGMRIALRGGLPAFLPIQVRDGIRHGNLHYIHIWTSMMNSYKGILGTWKEPRLDEGSIAQPHPYLGETILYQFGQFCRILWRCLKRRMRTPLSFHIKSPFFTTKAGPNAPNSILGAGLDAYLWYSLDRLQKLTTSTTSITRRFNGALTTLDSLGRFAAVKSLLGVDENLIRRWFEVTGQPNVERQIRMTAKMFALQYNLFSSISGAWAAFLEGSDRIISKTESSSAMILRRPYQRVLKSTQKFFSALLGQNNLLLRFRQPTLSRLHNLYEAAGKVRTIAIVDYWTNFALKPLHDWMFDVLKTLPQDATFDQEGVVEAFAARGYTHVYSYDLKSATDLIPLALYKYMFGHIMPRPIIEVWMRLLSDRSFLVPASVVKAHPGHPRSVRYKTGQPMGALTSWASMALLHHALVLFAAFRVGRVGLFNILDFVHYLVLGDDVVIADELVAQSYITLMKQMSIPVGLAKSHISEIGMFNFANQTFVQGKNVSPVSLKEEINAQGLLARISLVMRMARRGWKDMGSRRWLSNLLRGLVNPTIWDKVVVPLSQARKTTPFLHWIVASALLPGTSRFGYTGLSIDPRALLSTYVRKERLWSTRLSDLQDSVLSVREQSLLSLFTAQWVDSIYQQFLDNRIRLKEFDTWVTRVVSVDIEWLVTLIFQGGRAQALQDWADKFRIGLKEIQVASKIPNLTLGHLEVGTGMTLDQMFSFIAEAENEIPLIPDFSDKTLSAIVPEEVEVPARIAALKRSELQATLRVASLLVMLESIPLSPAGTENRSQTPIGFLNRHLKRSK